MENIIAYDVIIIGAGLTGLATAYYLKEKGYTYKIIEARNRLGGRIRTTGIAHNQPIELGATWLGVQHQHLTHLLNELEIETFDQIIGKQAIYEAISTSPPYLATLPDNPEPSLRIKGGTATLINKLAMAVGAENILLQEKIISINDQLNGLRVTSNKRSYISKKVISTLPPNLLINNIKFKPELPATLIKVAKNTHTWMGESIKIALSFKEPFWRAENLSGTIMSNVGPVPEMYDHSNSEESYFALMGFLNGNYHSISKDDRLQMILTQLRKYFGNKVDNFVSYEELVWRNESETFAPYLEHILPHQNNGHLLFQKSYMDDRLILAGTETSLVAPGYMEGAIYSALSASQRMDS